MSNDLLFADMLSKLRRFATPPPWMLPTAALMSMSPPIRVIVPAPVLIPPPTVSIAPPPVSIPPPVVLNIEPS
jgi:hypothetical protein